MSGINNVNKTKPVVGSVDLNNQSQVFNVVIVLCAIIFFVALFFFSCLRVRLRQIYSPRLLLIEEKISIPGASSQSFFSWIIPALKTTDHDIFVFSGIDALMFIRFLCLVLKLAIITLPFGLIVLLPINIYGGNNLTDGLDCLSMSNVSSGSGTLWAHWLAVWVYSGAVFYLTYHEWKTYTKYRQMYLKKGTADQFVVLVQNIPKNMANKEALSNFVNKLFPNKVESVYVVKKLTEWNSLIKKHDKYVVQWESAKAYLEQMNKRKKLKKHPCAKESDAINEYEEELQNLQDELVEEQHNSKQENLQCAFVFFKSLKARATALSSVWQADPLSLHVTPAPQWQDVIWDNLAISFWKRNVRLIGGFLIVFVLVIFWTTPILFISSLTQIQLVAKEFKWLDKLRKGSSKLVLSFIQGVVPVALISVFYILLPYILRAIARFQGLVSRSSVAMATFKYLFVFHTFNTFFIYIISGSVIPQLKKIIDSPLALPNILATSLPSQAGFFLNYISLTSFVGLAVELTRIAPLILTTIKLKFIARTERERMEAWKPKRAEYEIMYSQALLFFLIGISYSILSPIIIPFFVLYYAFGYVIWTYQLLHVYMPEFDHGGKFWPRVFSRIMVAVAVFQLLMIGVFALKKTWYAAALTTPLVGFTFIFWWFMTGSFDKCTRTLVLSEAAETKFAEKRYLESVRKAYVRNASIPDLYELSTDLRNHSEEYIPVNSLNHDTDEEMGEIGGETEHLLRSNLR